MSTLQSSKIRELGEALVASGYRSLDEQAKVLGLSRSTTWTILRANHKTSGLSAAVINRMLAQPHLPRDVRVKILEYVEEKTAGIYGHKRLQVRRFATQLSLERFAEIVAQKRLHRTDSGAAGRPNSSLMTSSSRRHSASTSVKPSR